MENDKVMMLTNIVTNFADNVKMGQKPEIQFNEVKISSRASKKGDV